MSAPTRWPLAVCAVLLLAGCGRGFQTAPPPPSSDTNSHSIGQSISVIITVPEEGSDDVSDIPVRLTIKSVQKSTWAALAGQGQGPLPGKTPYLVNLTANNTGTAPVEPYVPGLMLTAVDNSGVAAQRLVMIESFDGCPNSRETTLPVDEPRTECLVYAVPDTAPLQRITFSNNGVVTDSWTVS